MDDQKILIDKLNDPVLDVRLSALKSLMSLIESGVLPRPVTGSDVNNHIHTWYSFSPYSPTKAIWMAYNAGLSTAGIMDHDSVAGLIEFRMAGEIAGLLTTGGLEMRASFSGTPIEGKRINNPDQVTIAYNAIHGIPLSSVSEADIFLRPFREARNRRNRRMTDKINLLFEPYNIKIDFDSDVLPLSKFNEGGSVTERHLLFALSHKLIDNFGASPALVEFLRLKAGVPVSAKNEEWICNGEIPDYDLLGVLKAGLVEKFYIEADEECPSVSNYVSFAKKIGGISAYPYLGDVGDSVTGDKKAQSFEDSYLDELFILLSEIGYNAVTYMPSRNTPSQLERLRTLCEKHSFYQISGEDINSPRQKFICLAARKPEFANLTEAAYALIAHERSVSSDGSGGIFGSDIIAKYPELNARISYFALIGKSL